MAGGDKKIHEHPNAGTNNFKHRPHTAGRKPSLIKDINKQFAEKGFTQATQSDINGAYMTIVNLPLSQITEIAKKENDEYPLLYKLVAKHLLTPKGMETLEKLLNRSIGMPKQEIKVESSMFDDMSKEEIDNEIAVYSNEKI